MDEDDEAYFLPPKRQKHSLEFEKCDWISNLPDSLLLHILSFLKMEDVMKTTLLSRRWRYFWTTIPCLNFKASLRMMERRDYEVFVDRALIAYRSSKIKKLRLSYFYRSDSKAFQVDSWIHFALTHDAEELELDFIRGMRYVTTDLENYSSLYKVHSSCFNSMSLTRLTLRFCNVNLPASMCLSSLKVLSFELMELSHDTVKELTSSCPVLEELYLNDCNWRSDLNICIPKLPLKSLKIKEFNTTNSYRDTAVEIYAPNLLSLEFLTRMQRSKYRFKGQSSLLNVIFDIDGDYRLYGEDDGHALIALLKDLCYVENLKVDGWSIQVLAIREAQSSPSLSLNATSLELVTTLSKWELPGIAYMLRSCDLLETLSIVGDGIPIVQFTQDFTRKYDYDERDFWKKQKLGFSSKLQRVKTIWLLLFSKEECLSPFDDEAKTMEQLRKAHEDDIELLRFLLENCKAMVSATPAIEYSGQLLHNVTWILGHFCEIELNLTRTGSSGGGSSETGGSIVESWKGSYYDDGGDSVSVRLSCLESGSRQMKMFKSSRWRIEKMRSTKSKLYSNCNFMQLAGMTVERAGRRRDMHVSGT